MTNAEFESLVKQHARRMYVIAKLHLRSHLDAEDAVQRALLNLWRRVDHLDASDARAAFSALMVRATRSAAVDIIRERVGRKGDARGGRRGAEGVFASRQKTYSRDTAGGGRRVLSQDEVPGQVADAGLSPDDWVLLREALALVPPEYVEVMYEVYGHGAKIADLAKELGMEAAALRQKLCRFRQDIREALES